MFIYIYISLVLYQPKSADIHGWVGYRFVLGFAYQVCASFPRNLS